LLELHVELPLHVLVLLAADIFRIILCFGLIFDNLLAGLNNIIDFSAHFLAHELSLLLRRHHPPLVVDQASQVPVLVSDQPAIRPSAFGPVLRQHLPIEVFGPLREIKRKLESHISWKRHVIVHIVRGKHSSDVRVGAHGHRTHLVAAFDQVSRREQLRQAQDLVKVKYDNGPLVAFEFERELCDEAIGRAKIFE
jgi:hypothetical protein